VATGHGLAFAEAREIHWVTRFNFQARWRRSRTWTRLVGFYWIGFAFLALLQNFKTKCSYRSEEKFSRMLKTGTGTRPETARLAYRIAHHARASPSVSPPLSRAACPPCPPLPPSLPTCRCAPSSRRIYRGADPEIQNTRAGLIFHTQSCASRRVRLGTRASKSRTCGALSRPTHTYSRHEVCSPCFSHPRRSVWALAPARLSRRAALPSCFAR